MSDPAAIPTALVEQARALVEIEEARFAAAQTRATALLAATGLLGGIGGSILAGAGAEDYSTLILLTILVLATGSIGALLWSASLTVASLKKRPEDDADGRHPNPAKARLAQISANLASLLDKEPHQVAQTVMPIVTAQIQRVHRNTEEVHDAFHRATRALAVAVIASLAMASLVVLAGRGQPQEFRLAEESKLGSAAPPGATVGAP